ncbi:MAG TPA: hypothetical protein VGC19_15480 [Rhodanobacter sp.]
MNLGGGRLLSGAASVVMIVAIGAGLFVLGSPAHQRALRLDEQRTSALGALSFAIGSYWSQHKTLPTELVAAGADGSASKDPVSGAAYTYIPGTADRYQICAVFDAASESGGTHTGNVRNDPWRWSHPAGEHCFGFSAMKSGIPEAPVGFMP